MIRKNNKSKIFKIFSLSLVIFPNLSIIGDLLPKRNYFLKKSHLKNTSTLADDDYKTLKIDELTTKYPWLKKYRDDKNFANRDFNAYLNSDLIKKALIDQYLWYAMYAWNMFQCYIIKTYQKRLKFCYTFIPNNDDNDTPFYSLLYQRDIFFDTNFFKQCEKIDWSLFFDPKNLKFNIDYDVIGQDIASCFFDVEKNGGIYYIDEKDKNNKNNAVNLKIKEEIKKAKKETIDYCKEEFQIFLDSLNGNSLSLNKKIEKLISFLCDIVTSNRKIIDDRAIAKDVGNRNLEKTIAINFYHKALAEWLQNPYNVIRYIPNEAKPLLTNNKFEDFFNYLYCERKKYVNGKTIDFKKVMDDFIPIAQTNHSIIALEKAVASYTLAVLNNKKIISFTLEDHFAKYGQAYMKWITIITTAVTIIYLATSITQLVLTDKVSFITNISFVDNEGLGTHSDFFLDLMGMPFNDGSNISGFSKHVISAVRASYNINTGMLAYAREGLVIAGAIAGPDIINKLLQNSTNNRTNNIERIIRERAGNDLEERMPNIDNHEDGMPNMDNQENLNNGEGGNDRVLAEQERKRKEEERKRKEEEERRRKEEEERKRKEEEERRRKEEEERKRKLRNLLEEVKKILDKLKKLTKNNEQELTNEYNQLNSMQTDSDDELVKTISSCEEFKKKLEKRIKEERQNKRQILQNLLHDIEGLLKNLKELMGQEYEDIEENIFPNTYERCIQMPDNTDQELNKKIEEVEKFRKWLLDFFEAQWNDRIRTAHTLSDNVNNLLGKLKKLLKQDTQDLTSEYNQLNSEYNQLNSILNDQNITNNQLNEVINGYTELETKLKNLIYEEKKRRENEEQKRKEAYEKNMEKYRSLRNDVNLLWSTLVRLMSEQNDLTNEYSQLDSMSIIDDELVKTISSYEEFKKKLEKRIESERENKRQILQNLRIDVGKLLNDLKKLTENDEQNLTNEYNQLNSMQTGSDDELVKAISSCEEFKKKLEQRIKEEEKRKREQKRQRQIRAEKERKLRDLLNEVEQFLDELKKLTENDEQGLIEEYNRLSSMSTNDDNELITAISTVEKFKQKLIKLIDDAKVKIEKEIFNLQCEINKMVNNNVITNQLLYEYDKIKNMDNKNLRNKLNCLNEIYEKIDDELFNDILDSINIKNNIEKENDSKKINVKNPNHSETRQTNYDCDNADDNNDINEKNLEISSDNENNNTINYVKPNEDKKKNDRSTVINDSKTSSKEKVNKIREQMSDFFSRNHFIINRIIYRNNFYERINVDSLPELYENVAAILDPKTFSRYKTTIKKMVAKYTESLGRNYIEMKENVNLIKKIIRCVDEFNDVDDMNIKTIIESWFDKKERNEISDKNIRKWIHDEIDNSYKITYENDIYKIVRKYDGYIFESFPKLKDSIMHSFKKNRKKLVDLFSSSELNDIFDDEIFSYFCEEKNEIKDVINKIKTILNNCKIVLGNNEDNNNDNEQYIIKNEALKWEIEITKNNVSSELHVDDLLGEIINLFFDKGIYQSIVDKNYKWFNEDTFMILLKNTVNGWLYDNTAFLSTKIKTINNEFTNAIKILIDSAKIKVDDDNINGEMKDKFKIRFNDEDMGIDEFVENAIDTIKSLKDENSEYSDDYYVWSLKELYDKFDNDKFEENIATKCYEWIENANKLLEQIRNKTNYICSRSVVEVSVMINSYGFSYSYESEIKNYNENDFINFILNNINAEYGDEIRKTFVNDAKTIVENLFKKCETIIVKKNLLPKIYWTASDLVNTVVIKYKNDFSNNYETKFITFDDFIKDKKTVYMFDKTCYHTLEDVTEAIIYSIRSLKSIRDYYRWRIKKEEVQIIVKNFFADLDNNLDKEYIKITKKIEELIDEYLKEFSWEIKDEQYIFYTNTSEEVPQSTMIKELEETMCDYWMKDMRRIFDNDEAEIKIMFKTIASDYVSNWIVKVSQIKSYEEYKSFLNLKAKQEISLKLFTSFDEKLYEKIAINTKNFEENFDDIWNDFASKFDKDMWRKENEEIIKLISYKLFQPCKEINSNFIINLDDDIKKMVKNLIEDKLNKHYSIAIMLSKIYDNCKNSGQQITNISEFTEKFDDVNWKNDKRNESSIECLSQLLHCDKGKISSVKFCGPDEIMTKNFIEKVHNVKSTSLQQNTNKNMLPKRTIDYLWVSYLSILWSKSKCENWDDFAAKFDDKGWKKENHIVIACLMFISSWKANDINSEEIKKLDDKIQLLTMTDDEYQPIQFDFDDVLK